MIFEEALKAMREGKRVKRSHPLGDSPIFLKDGYFYDAEDDVPIMEWHSANLTATDWEIVPDKERGE